MLYRKMRKKIIYEMSNFITAFVFSKCKQIVPINTSTDIFLNFIIVNASV